MDRMKARGARSRNKFGASTRLKYRSRPGYMASPTDTSFVIERRLPANYKTIKTSSRSTVATSSSLSTYDLEEEVTDRQGEDFEFNETADYPKQAFNTNRETDEEKLDGKATLIEQTKDADLTKNDNKGAGYDVDAKVKDIHEEDKPSVNKPIGLREEKVKRKLKRSDEKAGNVMATILDDPMRENGNAKKHDTSNTVQSEKQPAAHSNTDVGDINKGKDVQPKTATLPRMDDNDTKDWKPIVSRPRPSRVQVPRDKCLNECGRCGDGEKKLKLLPCLHSFCLTCLESQVFETYRKMVRCDLCNSNTVVPATGLESLENNYFFHFSELSLSENDKCDICLAKTPGTRCTECKLDICSDCIKEHLFDLERNHYVVNLSIEMIGRAPWNAPCEKHSPFNLELFCINCSQLICGRCALESHANHVTENVEVYARDKRRELESKMADHSSTRLVSNIDDHLKLLKKERQRVQKDIDNTVDAIRNHVTTLKKKLDEFSENIVCDVKNKGEVYIKCYDKKIEATEHKRKATHISIETLHQIVHRTRDIEFIKKHSDLVDVLADMNMESKLDIVPHLDISYVSVLDLANKTVGRVNVRAHLKKPLMFTEEASIQFPKHVITIHPVDQVRAWVGFRKHIQQCTKDGTLGIRIGVGDHVVSITRNSSDTLFVACRSGVKALTSKLQLKELFPLAHEPSDMKFNRNDELVIAFRDARRLALFNNRGAVLKEFDIRHFGYRFGVRMNDPWKLAMTASQDVLLTDYTSEHVAVFGEDCEMKGTFRSNVYKQASIAVDGGLVFLVDYKRDCLNVFTEDGYFLQGHPLEGLKAPSCIGVISGCVWIGSWNGLVKCYHIR